MIENEKSNFSDFSACHEPIEISSIWIYKKLQTNITQLFYNLGHTALPIVPCNLSINSNPV